MNTTYLFYCSHRYKVSVYRPIAITVLMLSALCLNSCDSFTEIDMPITELNANAVFEGMTTANAAMANIFAQIRDNGMLTGKTGGLSKEMGLYSDELIWYGSSTQSSAHFFNNTLIPSDYTVAGWWNNAYSQIYAVNALIEGVGQSANLSEEQKTQLIGEAKFARGLVHFYLLQLYGDIPYVTQTDYTINQNLTRIPTNEVYDLIIEDLEAASLLLSNEYLSPLRTRPNSYAAKALLARVYLFAGRWSDAAINASYVINNSGMYAWVNDLNSVFLKQSTTTIWQYAGRSETRNTDDGTTFIFTAAPPFSVALSNTQMDAFEPGDQRRLQWTRELSADGNYFYHSFKYKKRGAETPQVEFTVVLRLAEMHLIRAEARAREADLMGAKEDLNLIRNRAGLVDTTAENEAEILTAILHERQVELFTEFAHRFMDLKRYGALDSALNGKPDWDTTDQHLPLPESELNLNSNLGSQNPGY